MFLLVNFGFIPGVTKYTNDPDVPGTGAYDAGGDPTVFVLFLGASVWCYDRRSNGPAGTPPSRAGRRGGAGDSPAKSQATQTRTISRCDDDVLGSFDSFLVFAS